jgi:hypothetical protein
MDHCTRFLSLFGSGGGSDNIMATAVSSLCLLHQPPRIKIPGPVLCSVSEYAWHRMKDDINMEISVCVCACVRVCV